MNAPKTRQLIVIDKAQITPNMIRVTLGGDEISSLPSNQEGGYIKLIFPTDGSRIMRTYTIRSQSPDSIDVDFVVHNEAGPASSWAANCKAGDSIIVGGPGPAKLNNPEADWHLLVGDMTALPAISVNLEALPDNAKGYALIEIMTEQDIQTIKHPVGVEVKWLINPTPGIDSQFLLNNVKQLNWLEGQASVWAACEFSSMKALRPYFKQEKQISKDYFYLSSYWKLGINEEEHKTVKRIDAEQFA
ncbi:siderophore-interacting protein [Marinomonas epiphytica]